MNILNLNEGSFPINLLLDFEDVDIPNIGKLKKKLNIEISISKISKDLLKCDGVIKATFLDVCQNCLNHIEIDILETINVAIKDSSELHIDSSEQDQTHYQNLEYFNIKNFIEEEIALIYPNIVKCNEECIERDEIIKDEKNLPFKKIRDLID